MENNKEKWVNEVMGSLKHMQKAESNPFLYEKVMYRIQQKQAADVPFRVFFPRWAALVLMVLVVNGYAMLKSANPNKTATDTNEQLSSELSTQTIYNY